MSPDQQRELTTRSVHPRRGFASVALPRANEASRTCVVEATHRLQVRFVMSSEGTLGSMNDNAEASSEASAPWWQTVHAALVGIARQRAGLDAEEARWIREAEQIQI